MLFLKYKRITLSVEILYEPVAGYFSVFAWIICL